MYCVESSHIRKVFDECQKHLDKNSDSIFGGILEDLKNKILSEEEWIKRPQEPA